MSYILEALKKLEQKRRREEGTLLLSDHQAGAVPRRKPLWMYLLFLALMLNAGLLLWWLRPWHPADSGKETLQVPAEMSDEASGRTLSGEKGKKREDALPHPLSEIPREPVAAGEVPKQPVVPHEKTQGATTGQSPEPRATRSVAASAPERPIDMRLLPPGLKQELPDLAISGHFFDAAPSNRIVIIGGRTLHEGQPVAPGLTLEQITRDGVVLNYRGTRFRKGIF